jgi:predicted acetyltransferase
MHDFSAVLTREYRDRGYREFTLRSGDLDVGFGVIRSVPSRAEHLPPGAAAHIGYLIHPPFRRHGYGRMLFKLLLREADRLGLISIIAACDRENIPSRRIIEAYGGEVFDEVNADVHLLMYRIRVAPWMR